jgi:hypothetical protein
MVAGDTNIGFSSRSRETAFTSCISATVRGWRWANLFRKKIDGQANVSSQT